MANNNVVSNAQSNGVVGLAYLGATAGNQNTSNSSITSGLRYNDKQYASEVMGRIARRDWQDYQSTFIPVHKEFKQAVMSDDLVNEQLGRIEDNVNSSYARTQQSADMQMQRMGLSSVDTGRSDLSKALSTAHGENAARQHAKERQQEMIAGANITPQSGRAS